MTVYYIYIYIYSSRLLANQKRKSEPNVYYAGLVL